MTCIFLVELLETKYNLL